jgi:glycosyltransferase involved in cell wall biosynthesis
LDKHVHIVTPDVPWPADYGGVIDPFYTIKSLHSKGVNVHLHCFTKAEGEPSKEELNKYCSSVNYYQRKRHSSSFSFSTPLIVNSRISDELIANLQKDNHPVILEGIHCTYYLQHGQLANRKVVVRLFNAEFEYYKHLAKHETNIFKKFYYLNESRVLKKYERAIAGKASILALSQHDVDLYKHHFAASNINYLPAFLPYTLAVGKEGKGCYCFYHGNLSINENEKAATWLLENVFDKLEIPFVIAGKNPSKKLEQLAHSHQHTCLVANPSDKELQDMIGKAHVHVLPSFNNTGIKLKLLNAVFNGRHCLVNKAGVAGSGLENYCHIAEDANSFQQRIKDLYLQPFTEQEIEQRQGLLQTVYNNQVNVEKLSSFLW